MLKSRANSIAIIADDLTGANDTGLQFARKGLHTEVVLEGNAPISLPDSDVVVIDTNSRAIPAVEAYRKVHEAAKQAHTAGFLHFYKKIDSTLRGNIGIELNAILDLGIHEFAFVMPAFLQNGRSTVGGHHLLQGIPLAATEIAKDPKCPVVETILPVLLAEQAGSPVGHIGINELCQGEEAIVTAIQRYLAEGCRVISCDAWLDEHFPLAVQAVMRISNRVLWSGSAGLAECLPQLLRLSSAVEFQKPTLVIAGSVSAVTRGQIKQLVENGYKLVEVEIEHFPWQKGHFMPCLQETLAYIAQGENVILASGYHVGAMELTQNAGIKYGMSAVQISEAVSEILGWLGAAILNDHEIESVVLTGGDTAAAVCRALGVTGIRILEELAPAIPLGEMKTAQGKTLRVITKAGAFGSPDILVKALERVQRR
ncbi:four-carbon acid sugar kinase family protein [Sporomusa sp.]|uniref:four-carbon acid sugar kinase family protein n=1 Tax=Sporomusa sp. TaxID=2078658 RepID=UPI002CBF6528|nr:four-carbon acid sugar kinase family protein [Sporomusa sp.]HWR45420.1 four-carbon acid sugar kinase family protein [Sporomusa sp.]